MILRIGLVAHGILCWNAAMRLWDAGDFIRQPLSVMLSLTLSLVGFLQLGLAATQRPPRRTAWLLVLAICLIFAGQWQNKSVELEQTGYIGPTTDVMIFSSQAARFLRFGQNPYEQDLAFSYNVYRANMIFATPLLNGDISSRMPYPALSILLFLPVQWFGISIHTVFPPFFLLTLLAIFFSVPGVLRPIILLPLLVDPHYLYFSFGGVSDIVWTFFLVMMIVQWRQHVLRAIWFGLACAFKQQPWFLVPFLIIRLWRDSRGRSIGYRLGLIAELGVVSGLVFLVINGPFMLWDFNAWLAGVLEPLQAQMIILGQGLSALTLQGVLDIPRAAFSVYVYGLYLLFLVLYGWQGHRWRELMWLVPGFVLWFGHRSLASYWYYFAIPYVLALVRSDHLGMLTQRAESRVQRGTPILAYGLAGLSGGLIILSLFWFAFHPSGLSVDVKRPIQTANGAVGTLSLTVHNQTQAQISPRFSVQTWTNQPFFWQIVDGPSRLAPAEVGSYVIHTDVPAWMFNLGQGAQVVISDAEDYDLRGSTVIEGENASRYYDPIANGSFEYWWMYNGRPAPYAWGFSGTPADNLEYATTDSGQPGVRMSLASGEAANWAQVMLDIWLPMPEGDLLAWINVPDNANLRPAFNELYGFEIVITKTGLRVWILYGDEPAQGQLSADLWYWMRPAPRGIWSLQTINIQQILRDLNIELPPPENFVRYNVVAPVTMVNFRLMGGARNQPPGPLTFDFGPIESRNLIPDPDQLTHEYLAQPEIFLMWRGDYNLLARNYDRALDYYNSAVELNPDLEEAYYRIALVDLIRSEEPPGNETAATSSNTAVIPSGG